MYSIEYASTECAIQKAKMMRRYFFTIDIDGDKSIDYVDATDLGSAQYQMNYRYFFVGADVDFAYDKEITE